MPKKNRKSSHAGHRGRLRKHVLENGLSSLRSTEVLELLLYYSIPRGDTRFIASDLINRFGSLYECLNAPSSERLKVDGFGEKSDDFFRIISMFIPKYLASKFEQSPQFTSTSMLIEYCSVIQLHNEYETVYALCLDSENRLVKKETMIAQGVPGYVHIEIKHVLDCVANTRTTQLVLCHNHPSGSIEPSISDIDSTMEVCRALAALRITLKDHIIICGSKSFSFREHDMLPKVW